MNFSKSEYDAVVVGSGPNGLACAIELARNKLSVVVIEKSELAGGGLKTLELTEPGFFHDVCSSGYPLAVASPFLKNLPLADHGLNWIYSPAEVAHPFADGTVALLKRSVQETAKAFPKDQESYCKLFEPFVSKFDSLMKEVLAPPLHFPHEAGLFARFGLKAILSAEHFGKKNFKDERARALFMGIAAHSSGSLTMPASAAVGLALHLAGHGSGWPIAEGGAKILSRALISYFKSLGGEVITGVEVKTVQALPKNKFVFFDLTPRQILEIAGEQLSPSVQASFKKYRYGPGVFKLDWALDQPIPWRNPETALAATVHLGNYSEEIIRSENSVNAGTLSNDPFILLTQPTLFDRSRAPSGKHIAWAYCHVPNGSSIDRTEVMENQIERFAPGFRKTIIKRHVMFPRDLEAHNPNLIGGDISGGLVNTRQLFFRPRMSLNPYRLDGKKYWICSSSAPPGPGVHGMSGYHSARAALQATYLI